MIKKEYTREGYTTGSCATAAAKAAALILVGEKYQPNVQINLPLGNKLTLPVKLIEQTKEYVVTSTIKDSGDDPDITNNAEIITKVSIDLRGESSLKKVVFRRGKGVGLVTKPGLPVPVGEPAINPVPRKMITDNLEKIADDNKVVFAVEVSIKDGEVLAKRTLNPHLGIVGGLSVLGTTGIVKPMSEEAFKNSLVPQVSKAKAMGFPAIILTPGNIGLESAVKVGIPRDAIAQTSNFIGFMIEKSIENGFNKIILWGHPGKLLKVAGGNFHTHNRVSDARMEILAAYLVEADAPKDMIMEILEQRTTDAAMDILKDTEFTSVWNRIGEKITERAERFVFDEARIGAVLLKDRENILKINARAKEIGSDTDWNILK